MTKKEKKPKVELSPKGRRDEMAKLQNDQAKESQMKHPKEGNSTRRGGMCGE